MSYNSDPENKWNSVKESDENKENLIMDSEIKGDSIFYEDEEVLNDSIISGKKNLFMNLIKTYPERRGCLLVLGLWGFLSLVVFLQAFC